MFDVKFSPAFGTKNIHLSIKKLVPIFSRCFYHFLFNFICIQFIIQFYGYYENAKVDPILPGMSYFFAYLS